MAPHVIVNGTGPGWLAAAAWLAKVGPPDLQDRIRFEHVIAPMDRETAGIHRGATLHLGYNRGQRLSFRPHDRFDDLART